MTFGEGRLTTHRTTIEQVYYKVLYYSYFLLAFESKYWKLFSVCIHAEYFLRGLDGGST
jgi:hypothetical protein